MEHRLHRREPVDFRIRLVDGGQVIAAARAVDMSPSGLGIVSPAHPLHSGQEVGLDFCKSGYPRGISCCLSAMVVHVGPSITGLMFANEGSLQTSLHELGVGSRSTNK